MDTFESFGLPAALMQALARMKFTTPTPIQAQAIPPALEGKDILGSAQTGTGKTAAFAIPMLVKLIAAPRSTALVLTPTRELAMQVSEAIEQMGGSHPTIKTALIIGGESMPKQLQALRGRPRVIVGTPGRINDHLARGSLMLHQANFLVLDETDRMLDMGFGIQLEKIFKYLPKVRQTLMFSATLPPNIVKLSQQYLTQPVRVSVGSTTKPTANVSQQIIRVSDAEKYDRLRAELDKREGSIIVFVKTKWGAERLADKLCRHKYSADAIHGDLQQRKRERVIDDFREKKYRILVATDIASRGLDIPHIEHVINYDLPQCPEDYIHRIGRTARNGAEGASICLLSPADDKKWKAIERLLRTGTEQRGGHEQRQHGSGHEGHATSPNGHRPRSRRRNRNRSRRHRHGGGGQHVAAA
jgi:superfamily II DNA/RNA helicase